MAWVVVFMLKGWKEGGHSWGGLRGRAKVESPHGAHAAGCRARAWSLIRGPLRSGTVTPTPAEPTRASMRIHLACQKVRMNEHVDVGPAQLHRAKRRWWTA